MATEFLDITHWSQSSPCPSIRTSNRHFGPAGVALQRHWQQRTADRPGPCGRQQLAQAVAPAVLALSEEAPAILFQVRITASTVLVALLVVHPLW